MGSFFGEDGTLEECCYFIELYIGCIIIAVLQMIRAAFDIIKSFLIASHLHRESRLYSLGVAYIFLGIAAIILFVLAVILLIGVIQEDETLIYIYLIGFLIYYGFVFIIIIIVLILRHTSTAALVIELILRVLIFLIWPIYEFIIVRSYYILELDDF